MISGGRVATAFASRPSCLVCTSEMNDWTSDGQGKSQKLCSFDKSTAEHHTLSKQTFVARDKCTPTRSSATGEWVPCHLYYQHQPCSLLPATSTSCR